MCLGPASSLEERQQSFVDSIDHLTRAAEVNVKVAMLPEQPLHRILCWSTDQKVLHILRLLQRGRPRMCHPGIAEGATFHRFVDFLVEHGRAAAEQQHRFAATLLLLSFLPHAAERSNARASSNKQQRCFLTGQVETGIGQGHGPDFTSNSQYRHPPTAEARAQASLSP